MSGEAERRVLLIEVDTPKGRWSSRQYEADLNRRIPDLRPVVFGAVSGSEVDGTFRKVRQLALETEREASYGDRLHSAQKAVSFFRDMWPDRFWEWFAIGALQRDRQRLLRPTPTQGDAEEERVCTGLSASWCPIHGDCSCAPNPAIADPERAWQDRHMDDPGCPLHAPRSSHAEPAAGLTPQQEDHGSVCRYEAGCRCHACQEAAAFADDTEGAP